MSDEGGERDGKQDDRARGPAGAEFLHLEVSRWLESGGRAQADEVVRELLKSAIRDRLEARLGERVRAVGAAIADEIADDFEANLAIEERIDARREARSASVSRAQKLLRASASKRGTKR
jgi:hypothetical protein